MRISDWSSDVCSSDLPIRADILVGEENLGAALAHRLLGLLPDAGDRLTQRVGAIGERIGAVELRRGSAEMADRKSVVEGKRGDVRVDLGGSRILTKKTQNVIQQKS